jgi:polyhydroxyalkanoate synthesis regulator phasin
MTIRNKKRTLAAAGASLALVATMVGASLTTATASAWAASVTPGLEVVRQTDPQPSPSPMPRPNRGGQGQGDRRPGMSMQQREAMHQAYLNALAGRLGISIDQLQAAMKQSRIDLINQAVSEGKLSQEQASRMIQAIQDGKGPGHPGMGQRGQRPGPQGQGQGQRQGQRGPGGPQVVADLLGMTPDQLRTELQSGKSLAQVAEAKGISRDTLKEKILESRKTRLDAAVAAGRITAEQAQQHLSQMSANIDKMLDATPGQRRGPRPAGTP